MLKSKKKRGKSQQNETLALSEAGMENVSEASFPSVDTKLRQRYELDLLGLPLSGHPLDSLDGRIKGITKIKDLKELPANHRVKLALWVMR